VSLCPDNARDAEGGTALFLDPAIADAAGSSPLSAAQLGGHRRAVDVVDALEPA
jgi:hypothetical protein